jgi:hypothetical protein
MNWQIVPGSTEVPGGPWPRASVVNVVESLVAHRMEELLDDRYRGPLLDPTKMETWRYETMVPSDLGIDFDAHAAAMVLELIERARDRCVRGSVLRLQGADGRPCVATAFLEFVNR